MHGRHIFTIESNERIAQGIMRMRLAGPTDDITAAGQFVNIALEGFFLRRPISVCDVDDGVLTIIYKVAGEGTLKMSRMAAGGRLDLLTGLGNGFSVDGRESSRPLLAGGGVGAAPLYNLARRLRAAGRDVQVVLGFNTAAEIFCAEEFGRLGCSVHIATLDGSAGTEGFVTDVMKNLEYDYIYSCGPAPMMRAVCESSPCGGQYSLEERMGCGFGACMGCTCRTADGPKRVCKEGPVFEKEEIIWQ